MRAGRLRERVKLFLRRHDGNGRLRVFIRRVADEQTRVVGHPVLSMFCLRRRC